MVFQVSRSGSVNPQSGMAGVGAGTQQTGPGARRRASPSWFALRPTQGTRSFVNASEPTGTQRGFPSPQNALQRRPRGSMPNCPPVFGGVFQNETPYYDRGAAAFVPNFGYLLTNPIGAGVVALYRPQASYGPAAQYANGAIWWTSQVIPTSINLQGLTDPEVLGSILSELQVQAVVRTTG